MTGALEVWLRGPQPLNLRYEAEKRQLATRALQLRYDRITREIQRDLFRGLDFEQFLAERS